MRVNLQPSYILNTRPYRDSSVVLEIFTAQHGRLAVVVRGVRRKSRGGSSGALLQPFNPLLLSFSGRAEMKNLNAVEAAAPAIALRGERLFSGLYINELLIRLLHRHDACPQLFARYGQTLQVLSGQAAVDATLRRFELTLLHELGYHLELRVDGHSGELIRPDGWYRFQPGAGLVACCDEARAPHTAGFAGADLLAMAGGEFGGALSLTARRLLRQALAVHLGEAPLRSRDLFGAGRAAVARGEPAPQAAPAAQSVSATGAKP